MKNGGVVHGLFSLGEIPSSLRKTLKETKNEELCEQEKVFESQKAFYEKKNSDQEVSKVVLYYIYI